MIRIAMGVVLTACVATVASGQTSDTDSLAARGIILHRAQAGYPAKSSWQFAESTGGGFSVSVPYLFDDYTLAPKVPGEVGRACVIEAKAPWGVRLVATRNEYPGGADAAKQAFERLIGEGRHPVRRFSVGAWEAADIAGGAEKALKRTRALHHGAENLFMVVELSHGSEEDLEFLSQSFFESLRLGDGCQSEKLS